MAKSKKLNKNKKLTDLEYEKLIALCKKHIEESPSYTTKRNALLIMTSLHTGTRASELIQGGEAERKKSTYTPITKQSLFSEEFVPKVNNRGHKKKSVYYLKIVATKGSYDREIPIPKWLYGGLMSLDVPDNEPLFPVSYNYVHKMWREFTPNQSKTFHCLKHTYALWLYKRCKDILLLQAALGHKDINNTVKYAQYVNEESLIREASGL